MNWGRSAPGRSTSRTGRTGNAKSNHKARSRPILLHGDVASSDGRAWCAVCRCCAPREHFGTHPYGENIALFRAGRNLLEQLRVVGRVVGDRLNIFSVDSDQI
jgi:hypothetical protein